MSLDSTFTKHPSLMSSAAERIGAWLNTPGIPEWATKTIHSLIEQEAWDELNDRFYKDLEFGTGGMRGRTIGQMVSAEERGASREGGTPEHAAVGANTLNDFNIVRATMGLFAYCRKHLDHSGQKDVIPSLVIAHDVRHFSRHFCVLAASVWDALGGNAFIFDGPRSTPALSFAVRYLKATTGIVITASHNPPHDNGYKVYFSDGAQVVSPHAEGIIEEVKATSLESSLPYLGLENARIHTLSGEVDDAYEKAILGQLLNPEAIRQHSAHVVFSPIHGTGQVASIRALKAAGAHFDTVAAQCVMDPNFSTVKSPNPENAEALTLALEQAKQVDADVVVATDPDGDRMGAAVKSKDGKWELVSGNQIGAMMGHYRIMELKRRGILPAEGSERARFIKTFVTTPLQAEIAQKEGIKVIDTLTGFKWIGKKLYDYEEKLQSAVEKKFGYRIDYGATPVETRTKLHLEHGSFYVFGGEESYGYLASDAVRDKDANAAVLIFTEMVSSLKVQGLTCLDYLEQIYREYGYYQESLLNMYFEGASGAAKIQNILKSYRTDPPKAIAGIAVSKIEDFRNDRIEDADGGVIPEQDFFMVDLENGYRFAVRASGTEPKIKFYCFGKAELGEGGNLEQVKGEVAEVVEALKDALEKDAKRHAEVGV